jgi:E3 ubiquitin-protein ligase makorin
LIIILLTCFSINSGWKQPNPCLFSYQICTFYQRGVCSYGARCRYDHVKPSRSQPITPSLPVQSNTRPSASYSSLPPPSSHSVSKPTWSTENHIRSEEQTGSVPVNPEEMPICSFAAAGSCPYGDTCLRMHGDTCPICGKQCLHPYRLEEREEHLKLCQKNNRYMICFSRCWFSMYVFFFITYILYLCELIRHCLLDNLVKLILFFTKGHW